MLERMCSPLSTRDTPEILCQSHAKGDPYAWCSIKHASALLPTRYSLKTDGMVPDEETWQASYSSSTISRRRPLVVATRVYQCHCLYKHITWHGNVCQ